MAAKKLTPKQKRFCQQYLIDLHVANAAMRAGYSEKSAYSIGSENLTKPEIQAYIHDLQKNLEEKTQITTEKVLMELARIGFANVQDFVNGGNSILELKHMEREKVAAVSSVTSTVRESAGKRGAPSEITTVTKITFHDKVKALEDLGKHLGIFERDNKQKSLVVVDNAALASIAAKING